MQKQESIRIIPTYRVYYMPRTIVDFLHTVTLLRLTATFEICTVLATFYK